MQVISKDQKLGVSQKSVVVEAETRRVSQIAREDTLACRKKTSLNPTTSDGLMGWQ